MLHICLFLGFLLHNSPKFEHWEVALPCKVLFMLLVSIQGSLRFVCVSFWPFSGILHLCLCGKVLGFLQDGIEMIKCQLLNNLKIIMWLLKICSLPLIILIFLNNRLKRFIGGDDYFIFIFEISRCISRDPSWQLAVWQNSPWSLCTFAFLAFCAFLFLQWVKKLSQCFNVLKRLACQKLNKLDNNLKIIYIFE